MSHTFDTGLAAPVRTLIRTAVAARIASKARANGGYLAAIVPFPRVIVDKRDEDGINHAWEALNGRAPAVLVAIGDATYQSTSTAIHRYQATHQVQVVVLSNSGRGLVDRLTLDPAAAADDTADPGLDVIEEHLRELLTGANLGLGSKVQDPQPVSLEHLETDKAVTMWSLNFTVSAAASVKPTREQLERLTEIVSTLTAPATEGTAGDVVVAATTEIPAP